MSTAGRERANDVFPVRLREVMYLTKTTQKALGEVLQVSRQMISQYCSGASTPDWKAIAAMAKHFDVSADYLLGLTDVKRPEDADLRAVCEYTGLSAEAVEIIVSCYKEQHSAELSEAIRSKPFMEMVFALRIVREKYFKEEAI